MTGSNNQAWLTAVTVNEDVQKALILCTSLRKVHTTRKIAVLVSPSVKKSLRNLLYQEFDLVCNLDLNENTKYLPEQDFAALYGLIALASWKKVACLSPFSLVLQNCDEIFNNELSHDFALPRTNTNTELDQDNVDTESEQDFALPKNNANLDICVFRPSFQNFEYLMSGLSENSHVYTGLLSYMKHRLANHFLYLEDKYCVPISPKNELLGFENDISIVHFTSESYPTEYLGMLTTFEAEHGLLGRLICKYWLNLLKTEVKPFMANPNNRRSLAQQTRPSENEPIAIVGTSLRLPQSNNPNEFWDILINGKDAISPPPETRERIWKELGDYRAGFLKTTIDEIDAKFFGMSPNDALSIDPHIRISHEICWEALEDAGIDPITLRNTSGATYVASWSSQYKDLLAKSNEVGEFRQYMGGDRSTSAARISFFLGMTGPGISVDSACSSSLAAVHLGCKSLRTGETNLAIVCGVNLLIEPYHKEGWSMVIAPDQHCKTFSEDADGYGKAEGCVALVLKRYSDAVKDGDRIWALVKGTAVCQEGLSNSFGTPAVYTESLVMKNALADANVLPEQVSFIEAHGTGTVVGDPIEIGAIADAYGVPARKEPLLIGTVKTNIGHSESASGMAGIMKVILSMQHEAIPAHLNFTRPNPVLDLESIPAIIPLKTQKWEKSRDRRRIAGVTSFGMTGTEAHVIIEEAPQDQAVKPLAMDETFVKERNCQILKFSARSKEALDTLMLQYCKEVTLKLENESIEDIAFMANTGRSDFSHRAFVLAADKHELAKSIQSKKFESGVAKEDAVGKICFLFTGQGSQYQGMAKSLYDSSPVFRIYFNYCHKFLQTRYGLNIKSVLWGSIEPSTSINRTLYSQTSIFCVEYALYKLWQSLGITPDFVLGHSLGEWCAAVCAGYLTAEDALTLVVERSQLIDNLPEGKMLVIRGDKNLVTTQLEAFYENNPTKVLDIAAVNSAEQTLVAGDSTVVEQFSKYLREQRIRSTVLQASHAFHSHHMNPMLEKYREVASKLPKSNDDNPHIPYISGMLGRLIEGGHELNADYWVRHTRQPVNFLEASHQAIKQGCQIFIEIGPQPVLTAFTLTNCSDSGKLPLCLPSIKRDENDWKILLNTVGRLYLKGVHINWKGLDMFRSRNKVSLPHYPFERKSFWPRDTEETNVHPLTGLYFNNASATKIFHNAKLKLENVAYIKDHRIGQTVVFPGAGYLEMSLSAANWMFANGAKSASEESEVFQSIQVQNLRIEAPLKLQESTDVTLQTVVDPLDNAKYAVKIHRNVDNQGTNSWLVHAQGECSTLLIDSPTELLSPAFSQETFRRIITQEKESTTDKPEQFYGEYAELGLLFGEHFQNLDKCWRLSEHEIITRVKYPKEKIGKYVAHPVILDALLQSLILLRYKAGCVKKLSIPIKIGQFTLLQSVQEKAVARENLYIHIIPSQDETEDLELHEYSAYLLDSEGNVLAIMEQTEFAETTAKTVQSVLKQQERYCQMPDTWEEVWHSELGLAQNPVDMNLLTESMPSSSSFQETIYPKCNENEEFAEVNDHLNKLVYWYILKSFYECGWTPQEVNSSFESNAMFAELNIDAEFKKQFDYFLTILEDEGVIKMTKKGSFTVTEPIPCQAEIKKLLASPIWLPQLIKTFPSTQLVTEMGENLTQILRGTQPALGYLFPPDETTENTTKYIPSAKLLYIEYGKLCNFPDLADNVLNSWLQTYKCKLNKKSVQVFRILEIGAGTGSYTHEMLNALAKSGVSFEYTYTDISSAFFENAGRRFKKFSDSMTFKKFNAEEDPLTQGFIPEYYDLILAGDVIHATKTLRETLAHVNLLLKPGGLFHLYETIRVSRFITLLFGLLEGYWRFEDYDLRSRHCTLSKETWNTLLAKCGFEVSSIYPYGNNYHALISSIKTHNISKPDQYRPINTWLVFQPENCDVSSYIVNQLSQLEKADRKVMLVGRGETFEIRKRANESTQRVTITGKSNQEVEDLIQYVKINKSYNLEGIVYNWGLDTSLTHQDDILQPYFYLVKALMNLKQTSPPKLIVLTRGAITWDKTEFWHPPSSTLVGFTRSLQNELSEVPSKIVEIGDINEQTDEELKQSLSFELWNWDAPEIAYCGGTRHIRKLQPCTYQMSNLDLPMANPRFQLKLPKNKLIQDLKFVPLEDFTLEPNDIEVKVLAAVEPNFINILSVLKPNFELKNTAEDPGFDFTGVVTKIGERVTKWKIGDLVYGMNSTVLVLPSHVTQSEDSVLPLNDNMTITEACTISTTAACIGVHCVMDVLKVTKDDTVLIHNAVDKVGISAIQLCQQIGATIICTERTKRKRAFLRSIRVEHVFSISSPDFEASISQVTNGKGASAILSTRNSEKILANFFKNFGQGARFAQLHKLQHWTVEEIAQLRPDVSYTFVNTSSITPSELYQTLEKVKTLVETGVIRPISHVTFSATNVQDAYAYWNTADNVTKVVCVMPESKRQENGEIVPYTPLFNAKSTYLITGGLGGIGWEVGKWMVKHGAKHIVLAGRSLPSESLVNEIAEANKNILANFITAQLDVGNYDQCYDLVHNKIGKEWNLPPLRGVMHAAGTLNDDLLARHTWQTLCSTFPAKIDGTYNLDKVTSSLPLEHFVIFSSIVAVLGTSGQSNHAAANCFEDVLAHQRTHLGKRATTINWGQWSEVGIAVDKDIPGFRPMSNQEALMALEFCLKSHRTQTILMNLESVAIASKLLPQLKNVIDEQYLKLGSEEQGSGSGSVGNSEQFWCEYENLKSLPEKAEFIRTRVCKILRNLLKWDDTDELPEDIIFQTMGVDSLMFIEMKNELQGYLGERVVLNANVVRDFNTVTLLTTEFIKLIEGDVDVANLEIENTKVPEPDMGKVAEPDSGKISELVQNTALRQQCAI